MSEPNGRRYIEATIPDRFGGGKIVLKELSASEEIQASRDAEKNGSTGTAYSSALAMLALVSIDGEKVTWEDGKAEKMWNDLGGVKRRFVIRAYAKVFLIDSDEDLESFFKSIREVASA